MIARSIHPGVRLASLLGLLWASIAAAPLPAPGAQSPRPAEMSQLEPPAGPPPAMSRSQFDSELIRRPGDAASASPSTLVRPQTLELPRVAGALVIVLGLIFLLRWAGKKMFNQAGATKNTRAIQVLSRAMIGPRQHIVLLRLGRRVIVVGESGAQMNCLAEITDADEIASLLGQLQDEKTRLPSKAFSALFTRARNDMGDDSETLPADDESRHEMSEPSAEELALDPAISQTQDEISGLADKIRVLSKHFRSGPA